MDFLGSEIATIKVPLSITVGSKRFSLNLNQYRNAHYFILNKAKELFTSKVLPQLTHLPNLEEVTLAYKVFPKTKALSDVANYCSIVDKFFSDTLVHAGKLPDDNYHHIPLTLYSYGAVDKLDPRVEVTIYTRKPL